MRERLAQGKPASSRQSPLSRKEVRPESRVEDQDLMGVGLGFFFQEYRQEAA